MTLARIQVRRGDATDWTSVNPTLASAEFGVEEDTGLFKIGDGTTAWNALSYQGVVDAAIAALVANPASATNDAIEALIGSSTLPVYNTATYGSVGDGIANDTSAIQDAIDACYAAGGGTVIIPPGTYLIDTLVLKAGVTLWGGLQAVTGLSAQPGVIFIPGSNVGAFIETDGATPAQQAAIQSIHFLGGGTKAEGIRLKACYRPRINGCIVFGVTGSALHIESGCVGAAVVGNGFFGLGTPAVAHNGVVHVEGTDHFFEANQAGRGVVATATAAKMSHAWYVAGANNWFSNNNGEFSDHGWYISGRLNRFTGCRGDRNSLGDWRVVSGAYANSFAACLAYDGAQDTSITNSPALQVDAGSFMNVWTGFQWRTDGGLRYTYGIKDDTTAATAVGMNRYIGCDGLTHVTARFSFTPISGAVPLDGGAAVRPASGTTQPNVDAATVLDFTAYTSNTTVTDFLGGIHGQVLHVIGDANVTLSVSSNITTITGGNRLLQGNRIYVFRNYNGEWYEVGEAPSVETSVASGASGAINLSAIPLGDQFTYVLTMSGNSTLASTGLPTPVSGRPGRFRIILAQGGSGNYTFSTTGINWPGSGATAPVLTGPTGRSDIIDFWWNGFGWNAMVVWSTHMTNRSLPLGNASGALDLSAWKVHDEVLQFTLTGNATLAPSGLPSITTGQYMRIILRIQQDATGSRTLTYDAAIKSPGGVDPVLTTTASAIDLIELIYTGTEWFVRALALNVA